MYLYDDIEIFWHKKISTLLPNSEGNVFFVNMARFSLHVYLPYVGQYRE